MNKDDVTEYAIKVFGSEVKAERWLTKEKTIFDGKTPMELVELGKTDEIKELLDRIANGFF